MPYERPEPGTRLKAYIVEVRRTAKGPQIVVSRTHPGLVQELFKLEVPEIADGVVEIKACAREPGHRTKIAVWSNDSNVDPVGACVGARGGRVRMVVNELRGEKIDIVPFSDDPADFVTKALSPAKVREVRIDHDGGTAEVIVPDHQLSLAIGKEGQNARLAARLTGWRIDIRSESQLRDEEAAAPRPRLGRRGADWAEGEWVVDPATGEQVWQPAEGGPAMSADQWSQGQRRLSRTSAAVERRRPRRSSRAGPVRTCIGCRRRAPQAELVRVVAAPGRLAAQSDAPDRVAAPGSAGTGPTASTSAERRRAFGRALRGPVPDAVQRLLREAARPPTSRSAIGRGPTSREEASGPRAPVAPTRGLDGPAGDAGRGSDDRASTGSGGLTSMNEGVGPPAQALTRRVRSPSIPRG